MAEKHEWEDFLPMLMEKYQQYTCVADYHDLYFANVESPINRWYIV